MKVISISNTLKFKSFFVFTLMLAAFVSAETVSANVSKNDIIQLTNIERSGLGLSDLKENPTLTNAAALKAQDMAARGYFSHNTPDGRTPWSFMTEAGYAYVSAGENLAVDFNDSEAIMRAWMNSPGHRANIANGNYSEIGVAYARGVYKGRETLFVVQMFGVPQVNTDEPIHESPLYTPAKTVVTETIPVAPVVLDTKEQVLTAKTSAPAAAPVEVKKQDVIEDKVEETEEINIAELEIEEGVREILRDNTEETVIDIEDSPVHQIEREVSGIENVAAERSLGEVFIEELEFMFEDMLNAVTSIWKKVRIAFI